MIPVSKGPGAKIDRVQRDIEVMLETDVLVCGGGPAGTAAAIAAARSGARVTLIERYNHLGGLATGGLVLVLPHFIDNGCQTIGGIGLHMRNTLIQTREAAFRPNNDSSYFDPEALKWLSLHMCVEAGVDVLHHCWLSDALVDEDGACCGAVFESKAGTAAARAKVVVDATGDGDIYAWAGADFEKSDQAIGLPFRVAGIEPDRWHQWARENPEKARDFWVNLREAIKWPGKVFYISTIDGSEGLGWGNNYYIEDDGLDPRVLSEVETGARLKIRHALEIIRQELPGWEKVWLLDTASQLGVRRSRRLKGLYVINGEETSQVDFRHPDAVGRGNDFRKADLAYDIPYGSLVPESLDGLLTCGRCLSCTHEALEPIREIHVCWVSGEAAGAAAGLAVRDDLQPREVNVGELQEVLRAADVTFAGDPARPY